MERVDFNDLEFSESECLLVYEGRRFSGIAFEVDVNGCLTCEISHFDGLRDGPAYEWYPSGAKRSEFTYLKGVAHGVYSEWFEAGKLQKEAFFEYGYRMREDVWDEAGKLVNSYRIDPDGDEYRLLQLFKKSLKSAV